MSHSLLKPDHCLLSSRNQRNWRERPDHPLLRPCLPEQALPPLELLQWRRPLPHPHLWQPVRAQYLHVALGNPCGAGRLQGPVWRRLSAADGPQALRAHGQLHLCVLAAIHHSHRTHWHHHRQSRWGHKHSHEIKMPVFTEAGSDKSHQQNQSSNLLVHLSTLLPLSWGQSFLVPAESPFKILHKKHGISS